MKHYFFPLGLALSLAACGAASGSPNLGVPQLALTQTAPRAAASATRSETPATAAHGLPGRAFVYVSNAGNDSITVYPRATSGNAAPWYVIAGPNTQLDSPGQLAQDASANLYVADGHFGGASMHPSVLVFAHGASGNVAPIRVLSGSHTGIHNVEAMTVDTTTGEIYVVDTLTFGDSQGSLLRFAAGASGNQAPLARSAANYLTAFQIANDSTGHNIIEAHPPICCSGTYAGVDTITKQFADNGQLGFIYDVNFLAAGGVVDDPLTHTYLATVSGNGIFRFAEKTVGSGGSPPDLKPAIVSIISSDTCGSALALGQFRDIYVAHSTATSFYMPCSADAVFVFAPAASGNATPERIIAGAATLLDQPSGIFEGP
jgi:hypothetical protein